MKNNAMIPTFFAIYFNYTVFQDAISLKFDFFDVSLLFIWVCFTKFVEKKFGKTNSTFFPTKTTTKYNKKCYQVDDHVDNSKKNYQ